VTTFVVNPFNAVVSRTEKLNGNIFQAYEYVGELELETINTQRDLVLQSYSKEQSFWKLVDRMKYSFLRGTALKTNSCFGAVGLCHALF
jgi:hypothetical protein